MIRANSDNYQTRQGDKSSATCFPPSGPTSPSSVDAALAETIITLRELEQVCFRSSRNSVAGLYFSQQRLLLMRLDIGKAPSRSDWLALAALGQKVATESEAKAA